MTELPECFLAVGAGVGLGPGVDADVLGQVAGVGKRLGAVGTLVGLGLSVVSNTGSRDWRGEEMEREKQREKQREIFKLQHDQTSR